MPDILWSLIKEYWYKFIHKGRITVIHGLEHTDFPLKLRLGSLVISAQNWISLSTLKQRWVTKLKVMLLKRGFLGSKSSEEGKRGLPPHTCRRRDIPPCNIIYYSSPKSHTLILASRKIFANMTINTKHAAFSLLTSTVIVLPI